MSPPPAGAQAREIDLENPIEVDEDLELTGDEAYESDEESSYTASVTSSVLAYRQENGRRYHAYKEGSYFMPNDETENDRLDFQHAMFLRSLGGKLCLAPIPKDIQHVVDIGTGTGIWAMDFADEYPSARVVGTDLSPIQPQFVPPNLSFLIDDAESDWQFSKKFDLIHGRMLVGSFKDFPRFFEQCMKNLKPGGYVEMHDIQVPFGCDDGTMPKSTAIARWMDLMIKGVEKMGRSGDVTHKYKTMMEEAGFVDVVEVIHKWPINPWAKDPEMKEIGTWTLTNTLQALQGLTMAPFTRGLGWTSTEVEAFLVGVRKDVKDRKIHCYWPIHFVYGRKPEE